MLPLSLLGLLALVAPAVADKTGKTGKSTTGCSCHSSTSDSTTTSTFSASSSTVEPGETVSISFIVASTSSSRTHAGLDVSATGGSLAAGTNNKLSVGEITHSSPTAMSSGSVTFSFSWTAPSTEGSYTLRGVGQAVNNDGKDSGDGWSLASNLSIMVDDGCDDSDGDGYEACDDGSGDDCADDDASIHPGAGEACDGVDNDCDGETDEADAIDATTFYADDDGDGFGDSASFTVACDAPSGHVSDDSDCDDSDAAVHPGAAESCNGNDDDCDGETDEDDAVDAGVWYADADGDGFGDAGSVAVACDAPAGFVADASDCDDTLARVNPSATESCDGVDEDCDGTADNGATDAHDYYRDADGDGYGVDSDTTFSCSPPSGYVATSGDCDDTDASYHPGATETCDDPTDYNCDGSVAAEDADGDGWWACEECDDGNAAINPDAVEMCDGADNDCDGTIDEDDAADAATFYADSDKDGYGDPGVSETACSASDGYVSDSSDCDDTDANAFPGAPETCDGADDDCDGTVDNDATDAAEFYADSDGDGYGDAASAVTDCAAPVGYVADASDCDDGDATVNPAAIELCNGHDDDCDGTSDEPDAADATEWYADADGDGFGDALAGTLACDAPEGFVGDDQDCDDADAAVNPDATETWYDGVDDDCDGNDADRDLDGWLYPTDCDDDDPAINPAAEEVWYDGIDSDCSGGSDYDADGDGYDSESYGGTDCDDADPTTYPGAPDLGDGIEHDCDVRNNHDRDGDGYDAEEFGGDDCDDSDSSINPGADDEWYDGIDSDCDGSDDFDQDGDGIPWPEDCDDTDPDNESAACQQDTGSPDSADSGGDDSGGWGPPPRPEDKNEDQTSICGCGGASGGLALLLVAPLLGRRRSGG